MLKDSNCFVLLIQACVSFFYNVCFFSSFFLFMNELLYCKRQKLASLATYRTAKVINNLRTPSSRGAIFGIFIDNVLLKAGYLSLKPHPRTAYAASPSPLERGVNSIANHCRTRSKP